MMEFRTVKTALLTVLGANAEGRFAVVGYQSPKQVASAENIVRVFYRSGEFPKGSSSMSGPVDHQMKFSIFLMANRKARGNLTALESQTATDEQRSAALTSFQLAAALADDGFDKLVDDVYQTIMDNRFRWLDSSDLIDGTKDLAISDRWIERVSKDDPAPYGEQVSINGEMEFSCRCVEEITGVQFSEEPIDGLVNIDIIINNDEDEGRAEVEAG